MDIIDFREYCLSLPLTEETTPFDEDTLVYKIGGKMYVYTSISEFGWICLKCQPDRITELSDRYEDIGPPVHMSKGHWISVRTQGDLPDSFVKELIANSYELVIRAMPRKKREEITSAANK